MLWLTAFASIVATVLIVCRAPHLPLPGPRRRFFIGSILEMARNHKRAVEWRMDMFKIYGSKTWGVTGPNIGYLSSRVIFIGDPKVVEHVLRGIDTYVRGPFYKAILGDLIGNSFFTADGELWRFHRKVAVSMFSRNLLREGARIARYHTGILVDALKKTSDNRSSIEIQELFIALTMDVFAEVAFDVKFHSIAASANKKPHPVAAAYDLCAGRLFERLSSLFWKQEKWLTTRGMLNNKRENDVIDSMKVLNEFADGVIAGKRRTADAGGQLGEDLISRFIERKRNDLSRAERESASSAQIERADVVRDFGTQDLKDTLLTFIAAGRDSTSALLTWTFYELCRHPQYQQKIREVL